MRRSIRDALLLRFGNLCVRLMLLSLFRLCRRLTWMYWFLMILCLTRLGSFGRIGASGLDFRNGITWASTDLLGCFDVVDC